MKAQSLCDISTKVHHISMLHELLCIICFLIWQPLNFFLKFKLKLFLIFKYFNINHLHNMNTANVSM